MKTPIAIEELKKVTNFVKRNDYRLANISTKFNLLKEAQLLPTIYELSHLHIVSTPTPEKEMYINWHQNKFYPDATIDNLLDNLEDEARLIRIDRTVREMEGMLTKILEILTSTDTNSITDTN